MDLVQELDQVDALAVAQAAVQQDAEAATNAATPAG